MALFSVKSAKLFTIVYSIFYVLLFLVFFIAQHIYWIFFAFIAATTIVGTYFFRKENWKYAEWLIAIPGVLTLPLGGPLAACAMTANEEKKKLQAPQTEEKKTQTSKMKKVEEKPVEKKPEMSKTKFDLIIGSIILVLMLSPDVFFYSGHLIISVLMFALLLFFLFPVIGIYLCYRNISKGLNAVNSAIETTKLFFVPFVISSIVGLIIRLVIGKIQIQTLLFNSGKSLVIFSLLAFVGALIISFIISKLKGNK